MPSNLQSAETEAVGQQRWVWPGFAAPGLVWLVLLFVVPLYAVLAVAMGSLDPIFLKPRPEWNPLQ